MTNAEKYKDAIITQICETGDWAVNNNTNEIMDCDECEECLFDSTGYICVVAKANWLNDEYSEPTSRAEILGEKR